MNKAVMAMGTLITAAGFFACIGLMSTILERTQPVTDLATYLIVMAAGAVVFELGAIKD